jgi:RNA polymerase sigma-70 factor (ECF subfamily)
MDETLVARAKTGDRGAMEGLLTSLAPSIHRFARRMCKNDADAEDVLQDALLSIAEHIQGFEGRSSLSSWAFVLTRSACSRRRRGAKNAPAESDDALASRPAEAPGPEDDAARAEIAKTIVGALDALPAEYREVLLLRDVEGLTAPETALALGSSVDAVKSRLHRARAALRESLRGVLEAGAPPPSKSCPDVVLALSRKLEDDLDARTCADMEAHVASCASCARACDAVKEALRTCRESTTPELTPEIRGQVRTAVAEWLRRRG